MLTIALNNHNAAVVTLPTGEELVIEALRVEDEGRQIVLGFIGKRETFQISRKAPAHRLVVREPKTRPAAPPPPPPLDDRGGEGLR